MPIVIKRQKKEATNFPLKSKVYYSDRSGFWGAVEEVNAKTNYVSVRSDTGVLVRGLPVACNEWVKTDDEKYVTGERHLPPVGSRVFVLMPTGTGTGGFVLCSGFARGETNTADFYAESTEDEEKKEFESLKVTQGGWIEKENYKNGNKSITSQDGKIEITLNNEADENIEKKVSVKAWGTTITIKEDGVSFETDKDITLNATNNNVSLNCKKFSVNNTDFTVGV